MLVKILGIIDILAGILFWIFFFFHIIPQNVILLFAIFLLAKGAIFLASSDIASIIDIACAGIILVSLNLALPGFIIILISLFLLQKGVLSLLA